MSVLLLSPEDEATNVLSFAENACGEGRLQKFSVLEPKRSTEVAEVRRFLEALQENQDRNYKELQEAIEYMNAKQSRLFGTHGGKAKIDERGLR